jgi:hypothetical protein
MTGFFNEGDFSGTLENFLNSQVNNVEVEQKLEIYNQVINAAKDYLLRHCRDDVVTVNDIMGFLRVYYPKTERKITNDDIIGILESLEKIGFLVKSSNQTYKIAEAEKRSKEYEYEDQINEKVETDTDEGEKLFDDIRDTKLNELKEIDASFFSLLDRWSKENQYDKDQISTLAGILFRWLKNKKRPSDDKVKEILEEKCGTSDSDIGTLLDLFETRSEKITVDEDFSGEEDGGQETVVEVTPREITPSDIKEGQVEYKNREKVVKDGTKILSVGEFKLGQIVTFKTKGGDITGPITRILTDEQRTDDIFIFVINDNYDIVAGLTDLREYLDQTEVKPRETTSPVVEGGSGAEVYPSSPASVDTPLISQANEADAELRPETMDLAWRKIDGLQINDFLKFELVDALKPLSTEKIDSIIDKLVQEGKLIRVEGYYSRTDRIPEERDLRNKATNLLVYLKERPEKTFTRDRLLQAISLGKEKSEQVFDFMLNNNMLFAQNDGTFAITKIPSPEAGMTSLDGDELVPYEGVIAESIDTSLFPHREKAKILNMELMEAIRSKDDEKIREANEKLKALSREIETNIQESIKEIRKSLEDARVEYSEHLMRHKNKIRDTKNKVGKIMYDLKGTFGFDKKILDKDKDSDLKTAEEIYNKRKKDLKDILFFSARSKSKDGSNVIPEGFLGVEVEKGKTFGKPKGTRDKEGNVEFKTGSYSQISFVNKEMVGEIENEFQELSKLEVLPPKEQSLVNKGVNKWIGWYRSLGNKKFGKLRQITVSTAVATPFAMVFGGVGVAGVGAFAVGRIARGVAGSTVGQIAGGAFSGVKERSRSKEKRSTEEDIARNINMTNLSDAEARYEELLKKQQTARKRDMAYKAGINIASGMGVAAGIGMFQGSALGQELMGKLPTRNIGGGNSVGVPKDQIFNENSELTEINRFPSKPMTTRAPVSEWTDNGYRDDMALESGGGIRPTSSPTSPEALPSVKPTGIEPVSVEASSRGAIETIKDLQTELKGKFANLDDNSRKVIAPMLNKSPEQLAMEMGLWKPGQTAESAMLNKGDTLSFENGKIVLHSKGADQILVDNTGNVSEYKGKMFDYDKPRQVDSVRTGGARPLNDLENRGDYGDMGPEVQGQSQYYEGDSQSIEPNEPQNYGEQETSAESPEYNQSSSEQVPQSSAKFEKEIPIGDKKGFVVQENGKLLSYKYDGQEIAHKVDVSGGYRMVLDDRYQSGPQYQSIRTAYNIMNTNKATEGIIPVPKGTILLDKVKDLKGGQVNIYQNPKTNGLEMFLNGKKIGSGTIELDGSGKPRAIDFEYEKGLPKQSKFPASLFQKKSVFEKAYDYATDHIKSDKRELNNLLNTLNK